MKMIEWRIDKQRMIRRAIISRMFLKNKYGADGSFEKIKARLVAGRHLHDRDMYSNGGSQQQRHRVLWL